MQVVMASWAASMLKLHAALQPVSHLLHGEHRRPYPPVRLCKSAQPHDLQLESPAVRTSR